MKRYKVSFALILTFTMLFSLVTPAFASSKAKENLDSHWAGESIQKWNTLGIIQGTPDGKFQPNRSITYAEFVVMLNRLFGLQAGENDKPAFTDVPVTAWYANDLAAAVQAGYYPNDDDQAHPNQAVKREEAVMMLAKLFALKPQEGQSLPDYKDASRIGPEAQDAVKALSYVIKGLPDGTFQPQASISRAEFITIIDRLVAGYYTQPGTYSGKFSNHVVVNSKGVILSQAELAANLYLTEGTQQGKTVLQQSNVNGTVFIMGRTDQSVEIMDSKLSHVQITRPDASVQLSLKGSTTIETLTLNGEVKLEGTAAVVITHLQVNSDGVTWNGEQLPKGTYTIKDGKAVAAGSGEHNGGGTTPAVPGGGGSVEPSQPQVSIVDTQATAETRSLFAYLKDTSGKKILFGHQHDTTVSFAGKDASGKVISDVKQSTGDYPAVFGWDTLSLDGLENPPGVAGDYEASRISLSAAMKEAYELGGIVTLSTHPYNFISGGDFKDKENTPGAVESIVSRILPGGDHNAEFNAYLDRIANFANQLKDDNGKLIPVLFRPFHEQNGGWFWWGSSTRSNSEYLELYRYTVEYLRDTKGVHNFLYVYSPNGPFNGNEAEYLMTYPGDDYVDILGMDQYDDKNNAGSQGFLNGLVKDLKMIAQAADRKGKIATLSEYGYSAEGMKTTGNNDLEWFTHVLNAIKSDPDARKISYMLTWANFGEGNNLFVPYKDVPGRADHELLPDFMNFYKDPYTAFLSEMKQDNKYNRNVKAAAKAPSLHIVRPTDVGTVYEAQSTILVKVQHTAPSKVTYQASGMNQEVEMTLDRDGYYRATWEPDSSLNGGTADITVKAYGSGSSVLTQTIKVFVQVREVLIKQLGFDQAADVDQIQNNGTWANKGTINLNLKHALLEGDGKLALEISGDIKADDSWQELKLELKDAALSGVDLKQVSRVKWSVLIPQSLQHGAGDAAVQGIIQLPPDWNNKYGMDTTKVNLAQLEQVTIDGVDYYKYDMSIDLNDPAALAAATGIAISIVGSGLRSDVPAVLYVDDIRLYNTYTPPVVDDSLVDDYESYGGSDDALRTKFVKAGGDDVTVSLSPDHKLAGDYGMKMQVGLSSAGYTGVGKNLGAVDWSGYNGLQLWVASDGSNSYAKDGQPLKLVIQIMMNGIGYEAYPEIKPDTAGAIVIPFTDFEVASWSSGGPITKDTLKKVTDFKLYVNAMDGKSHAATLYFDDIRAVADSSLPTVPGGGTGSAEGHAPGILYQFLSGTDIEGWKVDNNSAKAQAPIFSAQEQALSTTFALVNTGNKPSGASNESFELFVSPSKLNLTGLDSISANVKLSSSTAKARLFIKTGSAWNWRDSGTPTLVDSNGYTTLTIPLAGIPAADLMDVKMIGIMIEEIANDGGTAELYLQKIELMKQVNDIHYGFEQDKEGWSGNLGTTTVTQDVYSPSSKSLKNEFILNNAIKDEFIEIALTKSMDLSAYTKVTAQVRIVSEVANVQVKMFVQTGDGWDWHDSGILATSTDPFTKLSYDLSSLSPQELKAVKKIGFQIVVPEGSTGKIAVYIDDVLIVK